MSASPTGLKILKDSKGNTLIMALVGIAILGIMVAGISDSLNWLARGQRQILVKDELTKLERDIIYLLSNEDVCSSNWGDKSASPLTKNSFPFVVTRILGFNNAGNLVDEYVVGQRYGLDSVNLDGITIRNLEASGDPATTRKARAELVLNISAHGDVAGPAHMKSRVVPLNIDLESPFNVNPNRVINCSALGTSSEIWTKNADNTIYYNGGNVGIGTTTPEASLHVDNGYIYTSRENNWAMYGANTASSVPQHHAAFIGLRTRGTTSAPTYPVAGDALATFNGRDGIDGITSSQYGGAEVQMVATEAFTAANKGTRIQINTTANGESLPTTRMIVDSTGNVGIGTDTPEELLDISEGDIRTSGSQSSAKLRQDGGLELYRSPSAGNPIYKGYIDFKDVETDDYDARISYRSNINALSFSTSNTGGTSEDVRMVVRNDGFVGIGTMSPTNSLHVFGGITNGGTDFVLGNSDQSSRGNSGRSRALVKGLGAQLVVNWTGDFTGGTVVHGAGATPNLFVSGAASGRVGIGTTTPASALHVQGGIRATKGAPSSALNNGNQVGYTFEADGDTGFYAVNGSSHTGSDLSLRVDGNEALRMRNNAVGIFNASPSYTLHVNGSVAGVGAYNNLSDQNLKTKLDPITNSLEKLSRLKGMYFDWRTKEFTQFDLPKGRDMGVIAQDVEKVFPEAVNVDKDGFKSVAYSKLIAPMIEAINELRLRNEDLEKRNDALDQQNHKLVEQIKSLSDRLDALEDRSTQSGR